MCGFVGAYTNDLTEDRFIKAVKMIDYRGPNHSATQKVGGVWMGHNRLSILDLDARSHQPFFSENRRYSLIFNGEIYNYKEIRSELIDRGYVFRTESDTEVIMHSYDCWKEKSFIKLQGMFAFALLDNETQKIIIARDRFGEKPLFFAQDKETFVFASELKCITSIIKRPALDYSSIIDYLHFGFISAPKTIYQNIKRLKPGNFLEYSLVDKKITRQSAYYSLTFNPVQKTLNQRKEEFDHLGLKVASQISLSDVPLGAFLSGGVDSSGAIYFLRQLNKDIHTFTAGFKSESFDETVYAQKIVDHLSLQNTTRTISYNDFEGLYDTMVHHYDEPHNDFSFIPTYIICQEAVKHQKVMISGDGADEIFCGYPRYHKLKQFSLLRSIPGTVQAMKGLSKMLPEHSNLKRQLYYADSPDVDFFFHTMSMNFLPEEAVNIMGTELLNARQGYDSRTIIADLLGEIPGDSDLLQKQRYLDIKMTLCDDMLVKADRASMANSLEVRPFYLHPLLTDFAFSLPINELVSFKTDKAFLKKYFEGKLPYENLYRRKMGFTFPLKELIQGPLNKLFNECINGLPEELINRKHITNLMALHSRGDRNYVAQLHSLMNLGMWIRKNGY